MEDIFFLVRFFKRDGHKDFKTSLRPCNVINITFNPEDNTITTTSGGEGTNAISNIDTKNRIVRKQIIACGKHEGLHILTNGNGKVIEK